jgi:EAL domain-containing protein (putative c-di-GMP-specific phosphodiesterase class I)
MRDDEESAEIVRTIILLARNMRKDVVAEGVETPAQLATLRALACAHAQGYLFSPPQDVANTEKLLKHSLDPTLRLLPTRDECAA